MTDPSRSEGLEVQQTAQPARIRLDADERERYEREFRKIVAFVERVEEIPTKPEAATTTITGVQHVAREDHVVASILAAPLLAQSPEHDRGFVRVPRIR